MREIAIEYAKHFIGVPYRWRGDDPQEGFDCSGFVIEVLKGVSVLPPIGDWTADRLYSLFLNYKVHSGYAGCLVFSGDPISHVELCITPELSLGATEYEGFIRLRPYTGQIFVDPFMEG